MTDVLIELDQRRRLTLRIGHHDRYLAHEEPDGTLVLRPAVVVTADDAILAGSPALVERISRSLADPSLRTKRGRLTKKNE